MTGPRQPVRQLLPARDPIPRLADAIDGSRPSRPRQLHPPLYSQTLGRLKTSASSGQSTGSARASSSAPSREAWGRRAGDVEPPCRDAAVILGLLHPPRLDRRADRGGLERRREPIDRTKAIPYAQLERLWRRDDVAVREKALWRLLYETPLAPGGAFANVEDLDLENKRARVRSKGGDIEWLHLQSGSARLLPRLIAAAERSAVPRRPAARARTNASRRRSVPVYRPRAAVLPPRRRAVRRRVRRVDAAPASALRDHPPSRSRSRPALLMAKSRHTSLRSLQRYARPGPNAVAKLTAEHDPNADDDNPTIPRLVPAGDSLPRRGPSVIRVLTGRRLDRFSVPILPGPPTSGFRRPIPPRRLTGPHSSRVW